MGAKSTPHTEFVILEQAKLKTNTAIPTNIDYTNHKPQLLGRIVMKLRHVLIAALLISSQFALSAYAIGSAPVTLDYYLKNNTGYTIIVNTKSDEHDLTSAPISTGTEKMLAKMPYLAKTQLNTTTMLLSYKEAGADKTLCTVIYKIAIGSHVSGLTKYRVQKDQSTVLTSANDRCTATLELDPNGTFKGVIVANSITN